MASEVIGPKIRARRALRISLFTIAHSDGIYINVLLRSIVITGLLRPLLGQRAIKMNSSPPVRAWNPPESPIDSQYSLDLGALGLDEHSNENSPIPKQHVDRMLSEDIDGPSDFTLNMAKWMRGGTMEKSTMRSAKSGLQAVKEQEIRDRESVRQRSTLEVPQSPVEFEEDQATSHHTPDHSPPKASPWHEQPPHFQQQQQHENHEQDAQHDSSDWDPYAPSGTPQPPVHKQFLQPTVEDYHSELTPARFPSTTTDAQSLRVNINPRSKSVPMSPTQTEHEMSARPASETLSPVRSPVMKRASTFNVSSPFTEPEARSDLEKHMQQLQERCQQLEHLNSALRHALDEEQRMRKEERNVHERLDKESNKLLDEADAAHNAAVEQSGKCQAQADELKTKLARVEAEAVARQQKGHDASQEHSSELERLQSEMAAIRLSHADELNGLRQSLKAAEQGRDAAERVVKSLHAQLDQGDDATTKLGQLGREVEQSRHFTAELQNQVKHSKTEIESLRGALAKAEEDRDQARDEFDALRDEIEVDKAKLLGDRQRAVQLGEDQQKRIKELQQQLRDQQTTHATEKVDLESAKEAALASATTETDEARNDIEAQQSLLNAAILERDAAQDDLTALQTKQSAAETEFAALRKDVGSLRSELANAQTNLEDAREQIKTNAEINDDLITRISTEWRKKETHLRKKLDESENERQRSSKTLMRQYAVRSSPRKEVDAAGGGS
ncbi:hypothetical protein LTR78_000142 [Recurvomyces mirabilis]|uniref:Uncharacterized protein n=1 Tax=Recurvomyces mirabilis TaxID=574656 RepID=A0AAE0WWK9_9PEZI|nr:hypothetical protein LTR78_000142 [Recurvomyces mirabilis]KAK5161799.1 hypothetical protein LTS14_000144 [Recurvomyces mirabilis]